MGRIGKIARLPREVRQELNIRLQNGVPARRLVVWLNGLESVQAVLKAHFAAQPVNEPNITAWRLRGYADWKDAEETRTLAHQLRKDGIVPQNGEEWVKTAMTVKIAELSRLLLDKATSPQEQWKRLCAINRQVSRMRRDNDESVRSRIKRERWEHENGQRDGAKI